MVLLGKDLGALRPCQPCSRACSAPSLFARRSQLPIPKPSGLPGSPSSGSSRLPAAT